MMLSPPTDDNSTASSSTFPKADVEHSLPQCFEQQVRRYADRIAVKTGNQAVTYAELNHAANLIAHAILARCGPEPEPIALLLEQGIPVIAAILGVLKAGKMYVALDPSFPQAQLSYMLEDSQAALMVTDDEHLSLAQAWARHTCQVLNLDSLDGAAATENPRLLLPANTFAHILYTSGSTGRSKGVLQTHGSILHKIMINANSLGLSSADHLTLLYSCSYSASVKCIFGALLTGATLYPYDVKAQGLAPMADWLTREGISVYFSVPTVFRGFISSLSGEEQFPALRLVYLGGEPVTVRDVELYKKYLPPHCVLVNSLSSNETGPIRQYLITKETPITGNVVPVGYATPDNEVFLLDESGAEVGVNEIGEIVVKSHFLTPGYWRQPEHTVRAFTPAPEGDGSRLYRTGDLGRLRPDGCLDHLGRKDFQVKIRGNRIDVSEIELTLLSVANVKEAVVVPLLDRSGEPRLAAYVVPARAPGPTVSVLRAALQGKLPEYMIPSVFLLLETLPLTSNGKVDLRALPSPASTRPELAQPFAAPHTPVEQGVACLWAEILGLDRVGRNDPFFELGGHSLLATQIASRARDMFHIDIPLQCLLEAATVAEMSLLIAQRQAEALPQEKLARLLADVEKLSADTIPQPAPGEVRPYQ